MKTLWKRGEEDGEQDLTARLIEDAGATVKKYTPKTGNSQLDGVVDYIEDKIGYEVDLKDAAAVPISGLVVKIGLGLGSILFPPLALFALPAGLAVSAAAGALYHKRHKITDGDQTKEGTFAYKVDDIADQVKTELDEKGLAERFKDYLPRKK